MSLSYIAPHEEQQARDMVQSLMACPLPEPLGNTIAVKLFVDETQVVQIGDQRLIIPPSVACEDRTRPHAALVVGKSTSCEAPYRVGDFIVIPRHQGTEVSWYGHRLRFLEGDHTYSVLQDPHSFQLSDQEGEHIHVSIQ